MDERGESGDAYVLEEVEVEEDSDDDEVPIEEVDEGEFDIPEDEDNGEDFDAMVQSISSAKISERDRSMRRFNHSLNTASVGAFF
jgi:hypothetical protein